MSLSSRYKAFFDVESTGFDPIRNCVVSLACVVKDYLTGETHEFYEECRPDTLVPNYQHPTMKPWYCKKRERVISNITELWSVDAERVHGFTFNKQSKKQHPFDMGVKFLQFINRFYVNDEKIPFIYHANASFDWRFVKCLMHKLDDRLYYSFLRRFKYEYSYDTMTMAKAYIRENKTQLKLLEANNAKLTKPRKTKIQARYKAKWEGEIVEAKKQLKGKILFEGYSLDKLCKGLGVQLKHHNALSDAKAIIPIYDFFTEKSSQDQE